MSSVVAQIELIGRDRSGAEFPVLVSITQPVPSERMAPAWACSVTVSPISSRVIDIYGEGSFQALCLGAKHAVQTLATFVEHGGALFHSDGAEFEPEMFGFELLPKEEPDAS